MTPFDTTQFKQLWAFLFENELKMSPSVIGFIVNEGVQIWSIL